MGRWEVGSLEGNMVEHIPVENMMFVFGKPMCDSQGSSICK